MAYINALGQVRLGVRLGVLPTITAKLLDVYSGSAASYSLRKLSSTYSGFAIRVRRSSDNTEQNIGFDGDGNLDTTSLLSFVGVGHGFVTTWYDQSGNSKNVTQTTAARQPWIVESGVLLTSNGRPGIKFMADASGSYFLTSAAVNRTNTNDAMSMYVVYRLTTLARQAQFSWGVIDLEPGANSSGIALHQNGSFAYSPNSASYWSTNLALGSVVFTGGLVTNNTIYYNGVATTSGITNGGNGNMQIGGVINIGKGAYSGAKSIISELILYPNGSQNSNVTSINNNINSYYSVWDNIITSGLVLNLDAGKTASYLGTGSTWNDISGNVNNVTLYNTTYYSTNGGNIYLNGTNAWGYGATSSSYNFGSGDFSIDFWTYFDASNGTDNIYKHTFMIGDSSNYVLLQKWRSGISNGLLLEYCVNGNRYCITPSGTDPQPRAGLSSYTLYNPISVWTHIGITVISNIMYFYINGSLVSSISLGSRWSGSKPLYIGKGSMTTNEYHKGHISNIHIYKGKGLSATEILQNFNQTRSRFGV